MKNKIFTVISFSLIACIVHAESTSNEIIVTGTRTPVLASKLPIASTVISRSDIERLQVKTVWELLSGVVGLDVVNSGGYGKLTSVRIRGTEADHVLVIVDGVRIGSITSGIVSFEFVPVDLIDRVEIIRGPRSSIWGSDAIGGVIQIFTRKGIEKKQHSLSTSIGSEGTHGTSGSMTGKYDNFNYSGSVSYFDTDGIDARELTTDVKSYDRDGHNNFSFSLRSGYQLDDKGDLDVFILQTEGNTEFDSVFSDETDFRQRVIGASLSVTPLSFWNLSLRASENRDEQITIDTVTPISPSTVFKMRSVQFFMQNDLSVNQDQLVTLGFDFRDDQVESTTTYVERTRDNYGIYAQYLGEFGRNQITASVRSDENEAFGNQITGAIGWNYHFRNGTSFYASYGTAFKTPTFNELYFPGFGIPTLKPESSDSFEFGFGGFHRLGEWDVRAYHTEIDNLITTDNPSPGVFVAANTDSVRIVGIESELDFEWNNWDGALLINWLDPENKATGKRLPRRSKRHLIFDLYYQHDNWQVGGRVSAQDDRFDNLFNTIRVGGFVTVDLTGEYRISKNFTLRGRVGNLLNKDYETVDTYNTLGRNFFFSIHYDTY